MLEAIEVRKPVFNALNAWYAKGYDGMDLVVAWKNEMDNHLGLIDIYQPIMRLSKKEIMLIGAMGVQGYTLYEEPEDVLINLYNTLTAEEQGLVRKVLDTLGESVSGIN